MSKSDSHRQLILVAGLVVVIVATLGWVTFLVVGGLSAASIEPSQTDRFLAATSAKLLDVEPDLGLVHFDVATDGKSVIVKGAVRKAATLDRIKQALEAAEPKVPFTIDVSLAK